MRCVLQDGRIQLNILYYTFTQWNDYFCQGRTLRTKFKPGPVQGFLEGAPFQEVGEGFVPQTPPLFINLCYDYTTPRFAKI